MIYLDNAATSRPFDNVTEQMERINRELYFNPSALYHDAYEATREICRVREDINTQLGGGGTVRFTSCATEANTWVFSCAVKNKKGNVVVSMGEHASVYENAQSLVGKGIDVRFVKLKPDGRIDVDDFSRKTDENTTLVSVIHCSNETGAINDIKELSRIAKGVSKNVLFHSDGVQAFAKISAPCCGMGVDLYSISAHKIGGPKGVGGLWIRDGVRLSPLLLGGGQESGMRSGTENTAGIVGFGEALKTFLQIDKARMTAIRESMKRALLSVEQITINESECNSPFVLSFSVAGIKAEILQRKLAERGILVGLGSACASRLRTNRVLSAMGRSKEQIEGSVRISFGENNLHDDMPAAERLIVQTIKDMSSNR